MWEEVEGRHLKGGWRWVELCRMGAQFLKEGRTKKGEDEGGEKICVGDVEEGRSVDAKVSVEILHPFNPSFLLLVGILYQDREKKRERK